MLSSPRSVTVYLCLASMRFLLYNAIGFPFLIKYSHNTLMSVRTTGWHERCHRKIPFFASGGESKHLSEWQQMLAHAWRLHMHCELWLSDQHDECFLTLIMPCLAESLFGNLTFWQLTYAITTSKRERIGLSFIKRLVTNLAKANTST